MKTRREHTRTQTNYELTRNPTQLTAILTLQNVMCVCVAAQRVYKSINRLITPRYKLISV